MSLFRSEEMGYYNIVMPKESAWDILNKLGQLNTIHFIDVDDGQSYIQKEYSNYIKRCDEVMNKLEFLEEEVLKFNKDIHKCEDYKEVLRKFNNILKSRNRAGQTYFESIEQSVGEQYTWLQEQLKHFETLTNNKNHLIEKRAMLIKTKQLLGNQFFFNNSSDYENQLYGGNDVDMHSTTIEQIRNIKGISMNHITGVIDELDSIRFKRMVFRVTRGNSYIDFLQIDQHLHQGEEEIIDARQRKQAKRKVVFIIMYPGGALDTIKNKLIKICDSFDASRYEFPSTQQGFSQTLQEIDQGLHDAKQLCKMTEDLITKFLDKLSGFNDEYMICSQIEEIKLYALKEKQIYITMNKLQLQDQFFHGNCWIPKAYEKKTQDVLSKLQQQNIHLPTGQITPIHRHNLKPPTYFVTNEFTACFQQIVDTYGIPRYREVNPGIFTLMTFPFLFGVMYGDIGHGFGLFLFGIYLVFWKDKIKSSDSPFKALLQARYLIFFMGFFAFFCGFIYNDFLTIKLNLFNSCYDAETIMPFGGSYAPKQNCTYKFGMDPIWGISNNELSMDNSLKMKLAVILGVFQMMLGIILKAVNAIHFKEKLDFIFEFIPQIIFLGVTFFYMNIMIVIKWFTNYSGRYYQAPSIITLLINMPLKNGDPGEYPLYKGQQGLQSFFLAIALLCIPLMLLPKPIIKYMQFKKKEVRYSEMFRKHGDDERIEKNQNLLNDSQRESNNIHIEMQNQNINLQTDLENELNQSETQIHHEDDIVHIHDEEEHGFGELFVHQVIETIEFVLGSISNTASYLRLWALSLAHSQLAKVFFEKTLLGSIKEGGFGLFGNGIVINFQQIIGFYLFYMFTFGVLMCMDVLECFLHALRLHWVEFQNKFYKADGYKFTPFDFVKEFKESQQQS